MFAVCSNKYIIFTVLAMLFTDCKLLYGTIESEHLPQIASDSVLYLLK